MGFYFDWIEQKWRPINHNRKINPYQKRCIFRRRELIEDLLREIASGGNMMTGLYANLLLRTLVKTDESLMRQYGERVAKLSPEEKIIRFWGNNKFSQ